MVANAGGPDGPPEPRKPEGMPAPDLRWTLVFALATLPVGGPIPPQAAEAQELRARARWERMAQIRRDKFDLVLPDAMRENQIDMWITMVKEGLPVGDCH